MLSFELESVASKNITTPASPVNGASHRFESSRNVVAA